MNDDPFPFCSECGDPRLARWGSRESGDVDAAWAQYGCGHRTYVAAPNRRGGGAVALLERADETVRIGRADDGTAIAPSGRRSLVGDQLWPWVMTTERFQELELLASELVAHALGCGCGGRPTVVRVGVHVERDHIHVDVRGERTEPVDEPTRLDPTGTCEGLAVVAALSDRWGDARGADRAAWFECDL